MIKAEKILHGTKGKPAISTSIMMLIKSLARSGELKFLKYTFLKQNLTLEKKNEISNKKGCI